MEYCRELEAAIRNGDLENSSQFARRLASLNINLTIEPNFTVNKLIDSPFSSKDSTFKAVNSNNKISVHLKKTQVDLEFELYLDASKVTISELKKKVHIYLYLLYCLFKINR